MDVHLVNELVEIVLVTGAEIDEGLDGLVRVGGDVLALGRGEDGEHVVEKGGEVGDGVVDVGGFVDADERLVEDGEKVAEELEGDALFDDVRHHGLVALPGIHFEELLQVGKELGTLLHFIVDLAPIVSYIVRHSCDGEGSVRFPQRCSMLRKR